jgi:cellulose biosynthesis protein BcsQ
LRNVPPADLYIIPMGPSVHDWNATRTTWDWLTEHADAPVRVLFNRIRVGSIEDRDMEQVARNFQLKAYRNILHDRAAYVRVPAWGWRTIEYASEAVARDELRSVIHEITKSLPGAGRTNTTKTTKRN